VVQKFLSIMFLGGFSNHQGTKTQRGKSILWLSALVVQKFLSIMFLGGFSNHEGTKTQRDSSIFCALVPSWFKKSFDTLEK